MKVLDVLLYSQVTNPDGVPSDWPALCLEIDDSLPVTAGRTRMTLAQFASYKAARQAAYDAWYSGTYLPAQQVSARDALRSQARDFILNDPSPTMKAVRATAIAAKDSDNVLRAWTVAFKAAVAASTSLANLQARVAALPDLADITNAQVLNAAVSRATDGSAD